MKYTFDRRAFSAQIKARRGQRSLRSVAAEMEPVSASTLCRVENELVPDLFTFLRICSWLDAHPSSFFMPGPNEDSAAQFRPALETIELLLRTDTLLSSDTVDALIALLRTLMKEEAQ